MKDRTNYHSGWQRLGYAQREYAVHLLETGHEAEALAKLKAAVTSYSKAIHHWDSRYSAEAHYHRSKARWRLWNLTGSDEDLKAVIEDANVAAQKFYEDRFVSWLEFLEEAIKARGLEHLARSQP